MNKLVRSLTMMLAFGVTVPAAAAEVDPVAALQVMPRQAPGYYKWKLGDFTITSLSDGTSDMPVDQLLHGPGPGEVAASFEVAFARLPMEMSVNAFLIDTGRQLILVDAGGGVLYGPSLGQVRQNLIAAGYRPEQVNLVLLTHIHGDHSGGLMIEGWPAYPNASIRVGAADLDHYSDPARSNAAADLEGINFSAAAALLAAYRSGGALVPLAGETEVAPGVLARPTPGHSQGHIVYEVESRGERLTLLGDLVHVPQLQFAHPDYSMAFDFDEDKGRAVRQAVFRDVAVQRQWIAGAHLPFPGVGHLIIKDEGYAYVPAEYSANR